MRYTLSPDNGRDFRPFRSGERYSPDDLLRIASKHGLAITRPNGSLRIRGSRRLEARKAGRVVARFAEFRLAGVVSEPVQVGSIRGRLL